jgi:uncharacterized membrane protein
MMILASTLGGIAMLLAIIGVITGNKPIFMILTGLILVLWHMSTIRHAIVK